MNVFIVKLLKRAVLAEINRVENKPESSRYPVLIEAKEKLAKIRVRRLEGPEKLLQDLTEVPTE